MSDRTVCLRRKQRGGDASLSRSAVRGFEIEVPPHLARDLGLTVTTPLRSRVIHCDRPLLRSAA